MRPIRGALPANSQLPAYAAGKQLTVFFIFWQMKEKLYMLIGAHTSTQFKKSQPETDLII